MSPVIRLVNTVDLSGSSSPCHQVPCFWTCHVVVVQLGYPFPSAHSAATISCFFQSGRCFLLCWTKPQVVPGIFSSFLNSLETVYHTQKLYHQGSKWTLHFVIYPFAFMMGSKPSRGSISFFLRLYSPCDLTSPRCSTRAGSIIGKMMGFSSISHPADSPECDSEYLPTGQDWEAVFPLMDGWKNGWVKRWMDGITNVWMPIWD